jgi:hypothetical protein
MKHKKANFYKKANILVDNKAEFKHAIADFFRHEKEPKNESHVGLQTLFTIEPPAYDTYSNFDKNCKTKFVAKVIDDGLFQIFWKRACLFNDTFHFKYTDCETLEQLNESLRIESKLKDVLSKEHKIEKAIKDLSESMDDEVLRFAVSDPNYWMGAIGHIKRKISLYSSTIPTFQVLEPQKIDGRTDEEIVAQFQEMLKKALEDNLHPEYDKILKMNKDGTITTTFEKKADRYAPLTDPEFKLPSDTFSREEWQELMVGHFSTEFQSKFGSSEIIFDDEIIALAKGFMHGPVGAQRGKAIMAETKNFDSFEELKETIIKLAQEKDMFLYMTFKQETVDMTALDAFALSDEEREKLPKKMKYIWRGYFFDKE